MQHCTRCCRPVRISIWIPGCILMMPVSRRTICVRARQLWEQRSRFVLSMAHSVECLLGVKSSGLQKFRFQNSSALLGAAPLRSDTRAGVLERRPSLRWQVTRAHGVEALSVSSLLRQRSIRHHLVVAFLRILQLSLLFFPAWARLELAVLVALCGV